MTTAVAEMQRQRTLLYLSITLSNVNDRTLRYPHSLPYLRMFKSWENQTFLLTYIGTQLRDKQIRSDNLNTQNAVLELRCETAC